MNLYASTILQEIKCTGSVALVSQGVERERNNFAIFKIDKLLNCATFSKNTIAYYSLYQILSNIKN